MNDGIEPDSREIVENKNRRSLIGLLAEHGVTLPNQSFDKWRPTQPTAGYINGLWEALGELTCVATDGILGLFVNTLGRAEVYHVTHFIWTEAVVTMVPYRTQEGDVRYFKSVKEAGAPGPLHKLEHVREPRPAAASRQRNEGSSPRRPKSKRAQILADL